jgi:hypothetical protein
MSVESEQADYREPTQAQILETLDLCQPYSHWIFAGMFFQTRLIIRSAKESTTWQTGSMNLCRKIYPVIPSCIWSPWHSIAPSGDKQPIPLIARDIRVQTI